MKKEKKNSKEIENKEETFSYNGKTLILRKTGFKQFMLPAKMLINKFENLLKEYIQNEQIEVQKYFLSNPELFSGLTIDDLKDLTPKTLKRLMELISSKPELALLNHKIGQNESIATDVFLLTGDIPKQVCDTLFENCSDIDHSDDILNKLSKEKLKEYYDFIRKCFRFFLTFYKI